MVPNATSDPQSLTSSRDTLLGGGLLAGFAILVASTVWSLDYGGSALLIAALTGATLVAGAGLTVLLWGPRCERCLLVFPFTLFAAEVVFAAVTNGVSPNYSGFFALAIIYVGLTQRRRLVPIVVAVGAPCWLYCQEELSGRVMIRFTVAVTFWVLVGLALASRAERGRARTTELLDRANTDALTGLASRLYLSDQIDRELRERTFAQSSVMVIDLDGFKAVNDMFGHAVGDGLLMTIADRIAASFRPTDVCARLGGDEFGVLLRGSAATNATFAATRLLDELSKAVELPRGRMTISASIGIAELDGASDGQQILRDADLAMYEAKAAGRNRWSVYELAMGERRAARLQLEAELRDGLEHDQFELHYQPVMHLQTGAIIGTEALLRWNHPHRGQLAPDQFLNASEEIGVIVALGQWILREACKQAVRWQPADPSKAISMSVNVSASEMLAVDFVARVRDALSGSGLPGDLLILEITERLAANDTRLVRERINELRQLGVRIAIDDFGTGYASIAYLRELPVDIVKIDKSFLRTLGSDSQSTALLKAVVAVAEAMQLDIVVEGVERAEHVAILGELGCEVAQGYHFARPGPASTISELLCRDATGVAQLS